jgi:trehalose/maltose transport system substrate-binding protein
MLRSLGLVAVTAAFLSVTSSPTQSQVTVSISCSSLGIELELCQEGADAWAKQTGNKVKLVATPPDANERLALYQQLLAAGSADIDVFQIDVVWPGTLANHFVDLKSLIPAEDLKDHFETLTTNDTVEGKLVAVPFFVDAGLLYYRQDLLDKYGKKPPKDWAELTETAKAILAGESASNAQLQGFVWFPLLPPAGEGGRRPDEGVLSSFLECPKAWKAVEASLFCSLEELSRSF